MQRGVFFLSTFIKIFIGVAGRWISTISYIGFAIDIVGISTNLSRDCDRYRGNFPFSVAIAIDICGNPIMGLGHLLVRVGLPGGEVSV